MPMGTPETPDSPDTGHTPAGPSGGTAMTPAEIDARRAQLQAQLDALPTPPAKSADPTPDQPDPTPQTAAATAENPPAQKTGLIAEAQKAEEVFSHWLHLADGRVLKTMGTYTVHHDTEDPADPGVPVVAAIANPNYVAGTGDQNAKKASLLAELAALGIDLTHLL